MGHSSIVTKFKKKKGGDWLNDVADGFSFEHLHNKGILSEYVDITYSLNVKNDGAQLAILGVSIFIMTKALIDQIEAVSDAATQVIRASTPIPAPPGGVGVNVGEIITTAINAIVQLALAIIMAIAVIKLVNEVIQSLTPQKAIHKGVKIKTLFQAACDHLGLTLQSTLLNQQSQLTLLPIKMESQLNDTPVGFPRTSDGVATFGDLIREFKKYFDADYRLSNGVFIFERLEYFEQEGTFLLPEIFNDQKKIQDNYSLNTKDFTSNFVINFQFDPLDKNTMDNSDNLSFQLTYEPIVVNNPDYKLMKGLTEISLPFALGTKKGEESTIEKILAVLGGLAQTVLLGFGKNHSFSDMFLDTTDTLLLTDHFTGKPKILNIQNGAITEEITAQSLWQYHQHNSFVGDDPNQWYLYKDLIIPLNLNQFIYLTDNPYGVNQNGEKIRVDKLAWVPAKNIAKVSIGVRRKYTNNLKAV
jgi:hypothetical protein